MKRIAVFASGSGTNMRNIADFFYNHPDVEVSLLVCNKQGAGVLKHAQHFQIPVIMVDRTRFYESDDLLHELQGRNINLIVLAGFLWLIPERIINAFPNRIINIHPALLPGFGGKGMYGEKVHRAVIDAKASYSGITVHYVNAHYDEGAIIFQKKVKVDPHDTPASLAEKIHGLEYKHYPDVIERLLEQLD